MDRIKPDRFWGARILPVLIGVVWVGVILALGIFGGRGSAEGESLLEEWDASTSPYFLLLSPGQSQALPKVADAQAGDGRALQLQLAAYASPGPGNGPEAETLLPYSYGVYTARIKTASCAGQPDAGVVTGYFLYFNDGEDHNGDGLPDNAEIDFEWLCAEPETIYLTMWTDYRDSDEAHKRVARQINLKTGAIAYTCYFEDWENCRPLSGAAAQPAGLPAWPGYDSSAAYYQYGFSWSAGQVIWWIIDPATGQAQTLWDYRGAAEHIPTLPVYDMVNVWHTANWAPAGHPGAVQPPHTAVSGYVDWLRYAARQPWSVFLPLARR